MPYRRTRLRSNDLNFLFFLAVIMARKRWKSDLVLTGIEKERKERILGEVKLKKKEKGKNSWMSGEERGT